MSAQIGLTTSFLSFALLVGLLPAQEKPKTVDELRKENAALRQQVKTLRAQLDARKNAARRIGLVLQRGVVADKKPKGVGRVLDDRALGRQVDLMLRANARQALLGHLVRVNGLTVRQADGPLSNGSYRKSVEKLRRAAQNLNTISDPAKARKLADEIERALLDVRRELWKLEQARKRKAKDPTRKKDKQTDSSVVLGDVPFLVAPLQLNVNWPVLSGTTDPKDKLFFTYRRF